MAQSLQNCVDAVFDKATIKIVEIKPLEISGRIVTDTTTIAMSLNQAIRLQRRLAEAIAAASDVTYAHKQTAIWSEATLRAVAGRRVHA